VIRHGISIFEEKTSYMGILCRNNYFAYAMVCSVLVGSDCYTRSRFLFFWSLYALSRCNLSFCWVQSLQDIVLKLLGYDYWFVISAKYGTSHVIVLADFSPSTRTTELEKLFDDFKDRGFVIRWVNDTVALAVFRTPSVGNCKVT